MFNVWKHFKPYRDAGAFHAVIPIRRFIDDSVFLTKTKQLGIALSVDGIDDECLTQATLESFTKRAENAWKAFGEQFLIYQYVVKQDRAEIDQRKDYPTSAVLQTVRARREHLEAKAAGLFTIRLVYVILMDQPKYTGKNPSTRNAPEVPSHGVGAQPGFALRTSASVSTQHGRLARHRGDGPSGKSSTSTGCS